MIKSVVIICILFIIFASLSKSENRALANSIRILSLCVSLILLMRNVNQTKVWVDRLLFDFIPFLFHRLLKVMNHLIDYAINNGGRFIESLGKAFK